MYLVSLYFDEKTNQIIRKCMEKAEEASGNTDMTDREIPPHITLTVFESKEDPEKLVRIMDEVLAGKTAGRIRWVSVAAFFPQVLYLVPVLTEDLHRMMTEITGAIECCVDTQIQECYKPFAWQPHTTVARRLSDEQMRKGFAALQTTFRPFEGRIQKIGLSEGTGKRELKNWELRMREEEVVK